MDFVLFFLTELYNSSKDDLALDVIKFHDGMIFFNLARVNTVPCLFIAVVSLGLWVVDWIFKHIQNT